MSDIVIQKVNAVFSQVVCSRAIAHEIQDWFSFPIPNADHIAKKKGYTNWDGQIKLFKLRDRLIYNGLIPALQRQAATSGYSVEGDLPSVSKLPPEVLDSWLTDLGLPFELYEHQKMAVAHALCHRRGLYLSATSSGKSLIMYCVAKLAHKMLPLSTVAWQQRKTLIITSKKSLVLQLQKDFVKYGCDPADTQIIMGGMTKEVTAKIVISTWQSATKMDKDWLNQFDIIMGDEAQNYDAKTLKQSLELADEVEWRLGYTGSLDGTKTHEMQVSALFGQVVEVIDNREMIEKGLAPKVRVVIAILNHSKEDRKRAKRFKYLDEVDFIMSHERRNKFLVNLGQSLDKNSLMLFTEVERHGALLNEISSSKPKKKTHFIHGGINVNTREAVRQTLETSDDNLIIATFGTFQEGVSINNLATLILAASTKSIVRVLQSIGRLLRLHPDIPTVTIYDVVDDLSSPGESNYSMEHLEERISIYSKQGFEFKIINVDI